MSTRRKSTRATNFNNQQEQQRNEKIQKRQAVRGGGGASHQRHRVLTEAALQTVWQLYEKYANASPLLERYAEDGGGAGVAAAGARRSERRRAGQSGGGAPGDDDGGGEAVKEALAGTEAAAAAEAARVWEENGHHCLDLLEPLLLPPDTTAPKHVQEALMHMVLNAEAHRTHLSSRALGLLERLLQRHPPVRLAATGAGAAAGRDAEEQDEDEEDGKQEEEDEQEGGAAAGGPPPQPQPPAHPRLEVNPDLWEPVSGTWSRAPLAGLPRLAARLRHLRGLSLLAGGAHNCVARAVEAAGHPALPRASEKDAAESGDVGQLLLLRYWTALLVADMEVRLRAARSLQLQWRQRPGGSAEQREAAAAEARAAVEGSLMLRLMQTADMTLRWRYDTDPKPALVRLLAATAVYGAMGGRAGAALPLPGGQGSSGGPAAGGGGGAVAVPPVAASRLLLPGGAAEVGQMAGRLLGCLAAGLAAVEAADGYVRQRSAAVECNERVELDRRLAKVLGKEAVFGQPDNVQALLGCLPPAACVRLLSYLVAEAATDRLNSAQQASSAGGGAGGCAGALAALAAHYVDGGVADSPPPVLASPALRYLLGDGDGAQQAQGQAQGQGGAEDHWSWALRYLRLNTQMPGRVGVPLLVAALAAAGCRHAAEEARRADEAEAEGAGEEAGSMEEEDEEDEDGAGAGPTTAAQWRRELAAVAALSQRAAARLRAEGLVRIEEGAGAAGAAGGGGVASLATYIQARCAEQLARRQQQQSGGETVAAV
ncbi:hypothetical protein HYH02_012338 [Chlamydomonas schloesseri]|uniref:Uncharacterized protein n=1 Tax=Chlamydomonas schloesseri TaxID=2026947 RepID=A0A835T9Z2_9CHLO|nr:hypothetical protein HYH02_012338 [Chlamydomonas schloesseri]|eukprot:KAG2434316.1 hypothetical protein HYH02_012338 [Chlamydomonas schloesseri]